MVLVVVLALWFPPRLGDLACDEKPVACPKNFFFERTHPPTTGFGDNPVVYPNQYHSTLSTKNSPYKTVLAPAARVVPVVPMVRNDDDGKAKKL